MKNVRVQLSNCVLNDFKLFESELNSNYDSWSQTFFSASPNDIKFTKVGPACRTQESIRNVR